MLNFFQKLDDIFSNFPSKSVISPQASIHSTASITGVVVISAGAILDEYVVIHGPCFIGENTYIGSFCKLRQHTVLESDVKLENNVEVKHSLIGRGTHFHSGYIGDSIIGEDCRIGAGFITANRRLDRKNIRVLQNGNLIESGSSFFGCLMRDRVKIGIHCGTNPGTIIKSDTIIKPMTIC